jgi:tRNA 5-methylaminomethyl-2-thiouridine biosynthesis bifunctional protein
MMAGQAVPALWAGRADFTVLVTQFGLGHALLALWEAWRADARRPDRLHVLALAPQAPSAAELAQAHAGSPLAPLTPLTPLASTLLAVWPPLAPGLHVLALEGGCVRLTLAVGEAQALLPRLRLQADALLITDEAPELGSAGAEAPYFKALARLAAPGCTAVVFSSSPDLHEGLRAVGFEVAPVAAGLPEPAVVTARFKPRVPPRGPAPLSVATREAVVVGAGLAGASAARALAQAGLRVTVFDTAEAPAAGASGNPAGLFHAIVNGEDGPYARLYRAAALRAAQVYAEAVATGAVAGSVQGLLRLASVGQDEATMRQMLARLGLPGTVAESMSVLEASARAGVPVATAAWLHPRGGWLAPGDWVRWQLQQPGVDFRGAQNVRRLHPAEGGRWQLRGDDERLLATSALVVLANAESAAHLAPPAPQPWPLQRVRGQVSWWAAAAKLPLALPLAGDGYALPLPGRMLCGATQQRAHEPGHSDAAVREADHRFNLERYARLTGLPTPPLAECEGRVGWRLVSDDRLPVVGALPSAAPGLPSSRLTQARAWPRHPGLFVLTALGARGLTLAPLLGELVAAQALGLPWPLEQDLADAVDPARWAVRAVRALGHARG